MYFGLKKLEKILGASSVNYLFFRPSILFGNVLKKILMNEIKLNECLNQAMF